MSALNQPSYPRIWTKVRKKPLKKIRLRVTGGPSSLRPYRNLRDHEEQLRTLVRAMPDLVWLKDQNGVFLACNSQVERLINVTEAEIVGRTDHNFFEKDVVDFFRESDRHTMATGKSHANEKWLTFASDGYRGLFEMTRTPIRDKRGTLTGVLCIARDITERRRTEEQLRIAAVAFEAQEAIIVMNALHVILHVNQAFTRITGYSPEDVIGQTSELLRSDRHDAAHVEATWDQTRRDGAWHGEVWSRHKSGEIVPIQGSLTTVRDNHGEITHYVGTLIDLTRHKVAEQEIERLVFYDHLTRLPNRRLLLDRLQRALAASYRSKCMGALLFIDLDKFKIFTDTYGAEEADQLLIEAACRLFACIRAGDTVSRLGNDEFVVLLEGLNENPREAAEQAKSAGEEILSALSRPYAAAGCFHHPTPSIGVTLFTGAEISTTGLLKQAHSAMYQAKSAGRNTLRFFDLNVQAIVVDQLALETALRRGTQTGQFVLQYQPQVDSAGRILGAEALLRWRHPERGILLPAEFIPIAEKTGLILPIGQWVLEAASARLRAWADDPRTSGLSLAINVSTLQLRQTDFVDQVRRALSNAGAPATHLKLELTESVMLDDVEYTIEKIRALKALGVSISIDDFGTGYSSLSYVNRLPLDQIKIDQNFMRNVANSPKDAIVVQTIIAMTKGLGLDVIAEGVETEAQRQFLYHYGCQTYQGYLFSKPVELAEFEQLLKLDEAGQ